MYQYVLIPYHSILVDSQLAIKNEQPRITKSWIAQQPGSMNHHIAARLVINPHRPLQWIRTNEYTGHWFPNRIHSNLVLRFLNNFRNRIHSNLVLIWLWVNILYPWWTSTKLRWDVHRSPFLGVLGDRSIDPRQLFQLILSPMTIPGLDPWLDILQDTISSWQIHFFPHPGLYTRERMGPGLTNKGSNSWWINGITSWFDCWWTLAYEYWLLLAIHDHQL